MSQRASLPNSPDFSDSESDLPVREQPPPGASTGVQPIFIRDPKEPAGAGKDLQASPHSTLNNLPPLDSKAKTTGDLPPLEIARSKSMKVEPEDFDDEAETVSDAGSAGPRPHSTGAINGNAPRLNLKKGGVPKHIHFQDDVSTIDAEEFSGDDEVADQSRSRPPSLRHRPSSGYLANNRDVRALIPVKTMETEANLLDLTRQSSRSALTSRGSESEYESASESITRSRVSARSGGQTVGGAGLGTGLLEPTVPLSASVWKRRENRLRLADQIRLELPKTTHLLDMKPALGLNLRQGGVTHPLAEHKKAGLMPKIKESRKEMGIFKRMRLHVAKWWRVRRVRKRDPIPLFRSSLKTIEGHFGTSVASVFLFHRFVFLIDLLVALLWVSFVIIPVVVGSPDLGFSEASFPNSLSGIGLESTWMFYSGYGSEVSGYPMALMYLFVVVVMGLSNFLLVTKTVYMNYTKAVKRTALISNDRTLDFSTVVYSSWDHAVTSEYGSEELAKGIQTKLVDVINYTKHRIATNKERTGAEKVKLYLRRAVGILATLGIFAAVFFLVSFMVSNQSDLDDISPFLVPVIISAMKVLFPLMVKVIVYVEAWDNPKIALRNEIARIYGLKMFNIIMLVLRTYDVDSVLDPLQQTSSQTASTQCREARLGVEFWRLLWADLIVSALASAAYGYIGRLVMKRRLEFDYAEKVIDLIYRQALVWLGVLLSPILAFVGIISQYLLFHWEKTILMQTCKHPETPWNLRRTSNFFLMTLGVTLLWCLALTVVFVRLAVPECGPHMGHSPWQDWTDVIGSAPDVIGWIWEFVTSPIVLGPLVIVLFSMLMMQTSMLRQMTALFEQSVLELEEEHKDALTVAQLGMERAPVL